MSEFILHYGAAFFGFCLGFLTCGYLLIGTERIDVQVSARRKNTNGKVDTFLEQVKP